MLLMVLDDLGTVDCQLSANLRARQFMSSYPIGENVQITSTHYLLLSVDVRD